MKRSEERRFLDKQQLASKLNLPSKRAIDEMMRAKKILSCDWAIEQFALIGRRSKRRSTGLKSKRPAELKKPPNKMRAPTLLTIDETIQALRIAHAAREALPLKRENPPSKFFGSQNETTQKKKRAEREAKITAFRTAMPNLTNRPAGATTDLRIDSGRRLRRETIVKIKKRTHPFAMIDARALNDPRISWKAKGLHAYLMSKPKDWRVIFADLVKHATDRAFSVRTALNELLELGYAKLQPLKDARGLFCGSCWTVYEWPEQFLAPNGDDGFPNLGKTGDSAESESRENGVSGKPNPTNNEYPSNPTNKDRASKRIIAPDGERDLLGQIGQCLGPEEMKKMAGCGARASAAV